MAPARLTSLKPVGARSGGSITPMEEISDWPENNSVWAPATVRKMLGCPASAVESSTIPTTCRLREPTSMVAPMGRSMVLDTAASWGSDGGRPSSIGGIPGPRSGAPNTFTLRAEEEPSGMVALP